ncbi:hypothetical protein M513_08855 [Trichuris suis]|uniref:Uncharacterized protein n=1 Tax=Trichuris suis TaxID=68888 RepID=A0A085LZ31_9BILA|nr:hypothetical protein M513_08855 [Trichuris suis]
MLAAELVGYRCPELVQQRTNQTALKQRVDRRHLLEASTCDIVHALRRHPCRLIQQCHRAVMRQSEFREDAARGTSVV